MFAFFRKLFSNSSNEIISSRKQLEVTNSRTILSSSELEKKCRSCCTRTRPASCRSVCSYSNCPPGTKRPPLMSAAFFYSNASIREAHLNHGSRRRSWIDARRRRLLPFQKYLKYVNASMTPVVQWIVARYSIRVLQLRRLVNVVIL